MALLFFRSFCRLYLNLRCLSQVVEEYVGPLPDGEQESGFCLVISSEEEYEECVPLLEQGKVTPAKHLPFTSSL
jgi:hypothetical protein